MSRGVKIGVKRSARAGTRAAAANHDRSRFDEAGDTLVEVLLALIVLGLASVALLIAFSTSISASAEHRQLATSDIVLSAVSQQAIASVDSQLNLFTTCQTLSYFQSSVDPAITASVPSTDSGYVPLVTSVQYWNPTLANFGAACTTDEPEEITVTVTDNGHSYTNSFVVDYPLAGATTQSGAGSAAQLVWSTEPSVTASTSVPFAQQPVLEVEDANGNAVTTDLSPVIITIEAGSSGELSGCAGSEVAGFVTFAGCELDKAGTYTLTATDGNLTTTLVSDPTITVTGSTTPYLVFTTEPQGGQSGSALSPEPVITVEIGGVPDVAWPTGTINLSVSGGVWPSACDKVTVTLGVAAVPSSCTFEGGIFYDPVSNETLAVPYTISASGTGLIPATSTTFTVSSAGPATKLVYAAQPSGVSAASAATPFSTQPVVDIEDAFGNVVTSSSATISLALDSNSFGANLQGCSSTTTKGVATFTGCELTQFGTGFTLEASGSSLSLTPANYQSSAFNVTGLASYMLFTKEPAAGVSGSTLPTQPVITIYDANHYIVTASTTPVVLTASGGSLTLCTNMTPYQGVVTAATCNFAGVVGTNYTLTATQGLISVNSIPISPTGAGVPTTLAFTTQPVAGLAGSALTTQPIVKVEDSAGNVVLLSSATISLAVAPTTGNLSNCGDLQAVSGVVNVSGCTFGGVIATAYQMTATSANLASATSSTFSVTGPGPIDQISLSGCASSIQWGSSCTATATATDAWGNVATSYNSSITFAQTGGVGAVTGLTTETAVNGVATDPVTGSVKGTLQITTTDPTAPSVTSNLLTITVVGIPQSVAFYSDNTYTTAITVGTTTYSPAGSYQTYAQGSAAGTITFASLTPSFCTVNSISGLVTIVGAGTCDLTADAGATAHYADSGTTTLVLTINKANQAALTVTSTSGTYLTPLTLTDSGGSGTGADTYAVVNGTATGCAVNGSGPYTLTSTSAGTCLVTATSAADSNYNAISSLQATVTLAPANQATLTVTSTSGTYLTALTLTTSGGSGTGAVTYAVANGTATGCTVNGAGPYTLTSSSAGTCLVTAAKAADSNYNVVTSLQTTVTLAKANQAALIVTSTSGTYLAPITLTTSGGSGTGLVTFGATNGTATGCTVNGTAPGPYTLTSTSAGTCLVTATEAADSNYNAVSSAATTVTFAKANQAALTVTSTSGTYLTPLTLTDSGGSGTGADTYAVVNGTATGCTVNGTAPGPYTLTSSSAGTCLVTATSAADSNYNAVSSAQATVTLAPANQAALTVTSTSGTYNTALTLTTSGGSGTGAVTFAVVNGTASGCTVNGSGPYTLTSTSTGTCLVTATKAADSNYNAVSSVQTTVTLAKANQAALTVTSTSGSYLTPITLATSGGSGTGLVTFGATNGTATGCTVNGSAPGPYTLTSTSGGTCLVTATKAADSNYNAVSSAATTVTFAKINQATLNETNTSGTYLSALVLTYSGGSGAGAVSYGATNGTATGCAVAGSGPYTLTSTSAGTCLVTANELGNADYNPVSSAAATVTLAPANQAALTVTSTSGTYNTALTLTTSGGSGTGAVTFAVVNGTASGCTVAGSGPYTLTSTSTGTCLVTATKAADSNYNAVSSVQTTVTLAKANQAPLTVTSISGTYNTALTLTTSGGSGTGLVTFGATNGTATGCTVNGTAPGPYTLTSTSGGTCLVTATEAADSNYNAVSSAATTVTFAKLNQLTLNETNTTGTYLSALVLTYSGGSGAGAVSYGATNGTATGCAVGGSGPYTLNSTSAGTCLVTANELGNADYNPVSSAAATVTLAPANQAALTVTSTSGTYLTALTLATSGGSGTGAVTFAVVNGTATGCTVNGTAPGPYTLTATAAGTCIVTATSAADSNYNAISSAATTVTLFGTKYWSGTSTGATTVVSQTFTAPTGESVLILATYEGANSRTCNLPTGAALNTYTTVLTPVRWYTTGGDYLMCAYAGEGTNTNGGITETFSGSTTVASIQIIEITGDNNATFALAMTNTGSSAAPLWKLSATPTSNTEFLFGALTNGSATPPTWTTPTGFSPLGSLTMGGGATEYVPTVFLGAPSNAAITGATSATAHWGTIGIEVIP